MSEDTQMRNRWAEMDTERIKSLESQLRTADELAKAAEEAEYFDEASMLKIKEALATYEKARGR